MSKDKGEMIGHFHCIANEVEGKEGCGSSDAMAVYEHGEDDGLWYDGFCYSCSQFFNKEQVHGSSVAINLGIKEGEVVERKKFDKKPKPEPMTIKEVKSFIQQIGYRSNGYRGIKDEYNQFFGHLTKLDSKGNVLARYYPETEDGKVTGYKCRLHPKDFSKGKRGVTGMKSDLSGQVKFKEGGGKYCLLVGGEEDKVAAYQMLREAQIARNQEDYAPIPVVSPTVGEGGAAKQVANQYEWFDSFDNIIIGLDNDDAGIKAAKEVCKVLPAEKIKIAHWTGKDPNNMLIKGHERQFLRDFYSAKEYVDSGIKSATDAREEVVEFLTAPKIGLPPYLHRLQDAMRGGIRSTGAIVNVIGDTSIGKSFYGDNLLLHWFYHSPLKPTVISLERTAGEFLTDMYSLQLKKNLVWFKDGMDAVKYLEKPDVKVVCDDLVTNELGEPRFHIIDERDGSVESLKKQVDIAIKKYDSKLIIFDPLTDFLRALGTDEQENFMMWEKMLKKEGIVFLNILHTRKPPTDKEGKQRKVTEYDALGSGTFIQSADVNWVLNRNKMATDTIERNTTIVDMPKCRGGTTGTICELYYDAETRQQYDKDDFFADRPPVNQGSVNQEPTEDTKVQEIIEEETF